VTDVTEKGKTRRAVYLPRVMIVKWWQIHVSRKKAKLLRVFSEQDRGS